MESRETIIYGGSFNPPTLAHQAIVEACQTHNPRADIWLMPSGERYDKKVNIPVWHRLGMLRAMMLSLQKPAQVTIHTMEIESPGITTTHESDRQLSQNYPDRSFRYVFGADSFHTMPNWVKGDELLQRLPMLLVPRKGYPEVHSEGNVEVLDVVAPNISSSQARSNLLNGLPADQFLCRSVASYIQRYGLYSS